MTDGADPLASLLGRVAKMKVLVSGAGVLGSLFAARLRDAGRDVTVLARGQRLEDIREHGVVIEYANTGRRTTTAVPVIDQMPTTDQYDLCLVTVQKTQLNAALPVLAANSQIPAFLFMVNTAEGPHAIVQVLARKRVLMGFPNAGGERDGHVVRVIVAHGRPITIGELDGSDSERLRQITEVFKAAGFRVEVSRNIAARLRYHVALIGPFCNAIYMAGSCNYRLAREPAMIRKGLRGVREAIKVLRAHGVRPEPAGLRWLPLVPDFVLVPVIRRFSATKLMEVGGTRHAIAARDEMRALNEELLALAQQAGIATPMLRELQRYSDPDVAPAVARER